MSTKELLKRMALLEKRVAELEARPPVQHHHYTMQPFYPMPVPQYSPPPTPVYPQWPTITSTGYKLYSDKTGTYAEYNGSY